MYFRYQAATSLTAQLRAEQCSVEDSFSNQHNFSGSTEFESPVHSRSPPSPRPVEPNSQRTFMELMSPRLSQRRAVNVASPVRNGNQIQQVPPARAYATSSPRGFSSPHKKISSPAGTFCDQSGPVVVAAGVAPSIWVPRQTTELDRNVSGDLQRNPQNGHTVAYYTNSLPRLDRRTQSVGPHKSSENR